MNTADRFLYLITGQNTALRYEIGVGRDGFQWGGILRITRNAQWPDWTIGTTVYRIHGTNAPETLGQAVSSGCFRLVNEDIIDLYDRVPVGTEVVVQHLKRDKRCCTRGRHRVLVSAAAGPALQIRDSGA